MPILTMPILKPSAEELTAPLTADEIAFLAHTRGDCEAGCSSCAFEEETRTIQRAASKLRRLHRIDREAFARIESAIDDCLGPRSASANLRSLLGSHL